MKVPGTGLRTPGIVADAAFGPLLREQMTGAVSSESKESIPPTAPLHRYVSAYTGTEGASVFSDGLAEYEVDNGVVWVTLFRAAGELSRHDLPERPGHAGYPVPTPSAQSLGPFQASLAFMPHGPRSDAVTSRIEEVADDVLRPLRGQTWRTAINPPASVIGAELSGDGLACTTVKQSEDGEWTILRCMNLVAQPVAGAWQLPALREAMLARLDETPLEGIPVTDGRVEFVAPPRGVVTILAR